MDLYYRCGISLVGKKAKTEWNIGERSESSGGLGRRKPPFFLPRLPLRSRPWPVFFLFFPHCEPDLRLGFPALVPQKKFSFWPYNQSFINQLVRSRGLDIGLLIDPDFVSVHKTAKKNLANDQLPWPQAWSITHKCERAVIPLPWGITLLKQGKIHGKFREVKIRIEFPFPETMREKGNSFRRNDFWHRLGGQALLWYVNGCLDYHQLIITNA